MRSLKSAKVKMFHAILKPVESKNTKKSTVVKFNNKQTRLQSEQVKHNNVTRMLTKFRRQQAISTQKNRIKKKIVSRDDILSGVVLNFPKALKLLLYLDNFKNVIHWDRDKRLVVHDTPIQNTNFIDLLNSLLTPSAAITDNPGMFTFIEALKSINVPESLVVNKRIKSMLKE